MTKSYFYIFILTLVIEAVISAKAPRGCSIKLPEDIKGFAPVILTSLKNEDYQLFKPTGEITKFKEGSELLLVCTGNKNVFANTTSVTIQLTCSKGNFVDFNNNVQPLKELVCKSIPTPTLKITTNECSHGEGFIYESGFVIEGQFYGPVFEICYSDITENTFYTKHTLNGAGLKYSISESTRRPFSAEGMQFTTTKTNSFYTKKNQINRFEKLFGSDQSYLNDKNFLARGHLTPDADFIFAYEQLSTYYYANVAPQFQSINAGNWLRVEDLARKVASSYKDDIESFNFYMEVLELPKKNGDAVQIYLDDGEQIEAPKYFIKILLHRKSDSAIVFVSVNNPYLEDGEQEEFCTNVCKESGLIHSNFPDVTKGYTFCCELNEFKLTVDTLPEEITASKLLKR